MNLAILDAVVQDYISQNLNVDPAKIALAKSPFAGVSSAELATQISSKRKAEKKLPTWFHSENIYYPTPLSVEQTSSEITAKYKASLTKGETLIDITGGFGVDAYFFSKVKEKIVHCEIDEHLSAIAKHNAKTLGIKNSSFFYGDGMEFLKNNSHYWGTIYVDPARRGVTGKVFKLEECSPNILDNLDFLLSKTERIILKTSPLLDIEAGFSVLKCVKEIHVVSVKNECKELLWVMENGFLGIPKIVAVTLNDQQKLFSFDKTEMSVPEIFEHRINPNLLLYEPDVAVLKSGGQDLIAAKYNLAKLNANTQLYVATTLAAEFIGRIFSIEKVMVGKDLKWIKNIRANVIVRNYPARAEDLTKKYSIKPAKDDFLIFCKDAGNHNIVIKAKILKYY